MKLSYFNRSHLNFLHDEIHFERVPWNGYIMNQIFQVIAQRISIAWQYARQPHNLKESKDSHRTVLDENLLLLKMHYISGTIVGIS